MWRLILESIVDDIIFHRPLVWLVQDTENAKGIDFYWPPRLNPLRPDEIRYARLLRRISLDKLVFCEKFNRAGTDICPSDPSSPRLRRGRPRSDKYSHRFAKYTNRNLTKISICRRPARLWRACTIISAGSAEIIVCVRPCVSVANKKFLASYLPGLPASWPFPNIFTSSGSWIG